MLRLGIAAESRGEADSVTGLGDRVIVATADWAEGQLEHLRIWTGVSGEPYLDVHHASRMARARGLPVYGHFNGEPGALDAKMMRSLLALFADEDEPPDIVVVSRDTDEDEERRLGFDMAMKTRTEAGWGFKAVLASAHPEHEAWLIVAFEPETEEEKLALRELRQELGFDPRMKPHVLKAGDDSVRRNAKRVCDALYLEGDAEARFAATPLGRLHERGQSCGLSQYLLELREALAPHLGCSPP